MSKRMLIDATQADETRVVVLDSGRIEEIDVEIASKKQIKSNIYLARVTRVEPSLQAAFIDYGGNRHGFLPFSEIHPDYYQIPVADREALLEEVAELQSKANDARDEADALAEAKEPRPKRVRKSKTSASANKNENLDDGEDGKKNSRDKKQKNTKAKKPSKDLPEVSFIPIRPLDEKSSAKKKGSKKTGAVEDQTDLENEQVAELIAIDIEAISAPTDVSEQPISDPEISGENAEGNGEEDANPEEPDTNTTMPAAISGDDDATISEDDPAEEEIQADVDPEPDANIADTEQDVPSDGDTGQVDTGQVEQAVQDALGFVTEPEDDATQTAEEIAQPSEQLEHPEAGDQQTQEAQDDVLSQSDEAEQDPDRPSAHDSKEPEEQNQESGDEAGTVENESEDDGVEEAEQENRNIMRSLLANRYKIQEVIKRRQVLLVQVTKEERGNKGAALTTYLSLAGRYCVLMPNTSRGGGISRKIASVKDRKRLKRVMDNLDVPSGISVIVRTAGSERTAAEIKRDYEYLGRTWDRIREDTLDSTAPCLIHEEGNIIKRAIRDIYSSDMEQISVDGESGYKAAKSFMKMLSPSHAARVKRHPSNETPLFIKEGIEDELESLHNHIVQLPSGGYIVLNQTEALVAVDVNSGRAIKERHIEDTALKTNLEAATEVARQLRLRDLAGLVVIDFIDMEEPRNNTQVERRLREGLRRDRARVQTSKISGFGLLELSRQRIRPSVMEATHTNCETCNGTGLMRASGALALSVLRSVEERLTGKEYDFVHLCVPAEIAMALLNDRRAKMTDVESRLNIRIIVEIDQALGREEHKLYFMDARHGRIEIADPKAKKTERPNKRRSGPDKESDGGENGDRRKDSKQRGRGKSDKDEEKPKASRRRKDDKAKDEKKKKDTKSVDETKAEDFEDDALDKRRRRGKRGGKKRKRGDEDLVSVSNETHLNEVARLDAPQPGLEPEHAEASQDAAATTTPSASTADAEELTVSTSSELGNSEDVAQDPSTAEEETPTIEQAQDADTATDQSKGPETEPKDETPPKPKRKGWWST